jgi:hypothetical protein
VSVFIAVALDPHLVTGEQTRVGWCAGWVISGRSRHLCFLMNEIARVSPSA